LIADAVFDNDDVNRPHIRIRPDGRLAKRP